MSVLVLCPTRRPIEADRLLESVRRTSDASIAFYVDQDQAGFYRPSKDNHVGPRIGPVMAANELVRINPGFDWYGFIPDDSLFTVSGWDKYLVGADADAVQIANGSIWWPDMFFVSAKWIERLGWFAPPSLYHWCWPTAINAIAEATTKEIADPDRLNVDHYRAEPMNRERELSDYAAFHLFMAHDFSGCVAKMRAA